MSDGEPGKACTLCAELKPLDEFPLDRTRKDGRFPRCKACHRKKAREDRGLRADEINARWRRRYAADPEPHRKRSAEYAASNRDSVLARQREWHEANRERQLERQRNYRAANEEVLKAKRQARYRALYSAALERNAAQGLCVGTVRNGFKCGSRASKARRTCEACNLQSQTLRKRAKINWESQGRGVCHLCDLALDLVLDPWHADHIVPRSLGGSDAAANLLPSHAHCNLERRATDLATWRSLRNLPPL